MDNIVHEGPIIEFFLSYTFEYRFIDTVMPMSWTTYTYFVDRMPAG